MVAVGQAVLDVVQSGVDQHAVVVPGGALSGAAAGKRDSVMATREICVRN